jgi:hypothetical protein
VTGTGSAGPPDGRVACRSHRLLPVRPTKPSRDTPGNLPVWPGAPGVCWPTRRACHRGGPWSGAVGPEFCEPTGRGRRNHDLRPAEPSGWPPCRRVHRQPAPASPSAVARPIPHEQQPVTSTAFETTIPNPPFRIGVMSEFSPAARSAGTPGAEVPQPRTPRPRTRRHVEIRAGDRHSRRYCQRTGTLSSGPPPRSGGSGGGDPWRS